MERRKLNRQRIKRSVYLVGQVDTAAADWRAWYDFCIHFFGQRGCSANYLGFESETLHPNGIRTMNRFGSKARKAIDRKEPIYSL